MSSRQHGREWRLELVLKVCLDQGRRRKKNLSLEKGKNKHIPKMPKHLTVCSYVSVSFMLFFCNHFHSSFSNCFLCVALVLCFPISVIICSALIVSTCVSFAVQLLIVVPCLPCQSLSLLSQPVYLPVILLTTIFFHVCLCVSSDFGFKQKNKKQNQTTVILIIIITHSWQFVIYSHKL